MGTIWRASANGNTFLVLHGRPDAEAILNNLRTYNQWTFDTALVLADNGRATRMRVCERDGSESVMCGNGARAVAALLFALGRPLEVSVQGQLLLVERQANNEFAVSMGQPVLAGHTHLFVGVGALVAPRYEVLGEPHVVVLCDDVACFPVSIVGMSVVPQANLTVVSRLGQNRWAARTFERGVNRETASCGTGACAAVWHVMQTGLARGQEVSVFMGGHRLTVRVCGDQLWLSGTTDLIQQRED
ncbi:MAG: hypothetical protein HY461_02210 [Parcubacteria group bacterium]|nr:hypothetical protein [Parcubacteria group bacterium]